MVAKEFYSDQLEAGNEGSTHLLQDPYEEEEEEEALSLCDLPIHHDSCQSHNKNDDVAIDNDDDFFGFFNEDFNNSTLAASGNIIFCNKLIPFKEPSSQVKSTPLKAAKSCDVNYLKKGRETKGLKSFTCDYHSSTDKVLMMRCSTKSRWFFFMFGIMSSRLSTTEMELRDIRSRQSRRGAPAPTMFPTPENREEVKEGKEEGRIMTRKGLWRMLRSLGIGLGCNSRRKLANDVVKAAFV